ncbi:MAG: ATP-binding cassette domain-containing protein [Candidatus Hydrogenedentes bacterium]|nr:ATP-binding cassette domain-containing protein [Candidatus Hydrogenedentota bacterium]
MTETDHPPAVRLDRVTLRFGGKTVLRRLSFEVAPGQKITLTGRSGSGKTSILRCILGFTIPDEGAVYIEGAGTRPRHGNRNRNPRAAVLLPGKPAIAQKPR